MNVGLIVDSKLDVGVRTYMALLLFCFSAVTD